MSASLWDEEHLGGWVVGGDPATWLPSVWSWAIDMLGVVSMLDVGCGDGRAMEWFQDHGVHAFGVEGTPQAKANIFQHDYTKGPLEEIAGLRWDMIWCCEFVEHVEEQYVHNFLDTFETAEYVLMTHGEPGQPGTHHVNCQPADYWIERLASRGFDLDEELTRSARLAATANTFTWTDDRGTHRNHFLRSGMVFHNRHVTGAAWQARRLASLVASP